MRRMRLAVGLAGAVLVATGVLMGVSSCGSGASSVPAENNAEPHVVGKSRAEIGKYIVLTSGCNDCHTEGWKFGKDVPEEKWLTGVPIGWRGAWGTTYATNLRLSVQPYTEEIFIKAMRLRDSKPPMPWRSLHAMTDSDLGAVFVYIKGLGPAGERMPVAVPAGMEPEGPYVSTEVHEK